MSRRHWGAGTVAGASLLGLMAGSALGPAGSSTSVVVGALFLQTLLVVSALPVGWHSDTQVRRNALALLMLHHLAATIPLLLLAATLGWNTPLAIGVLILAIVPVAAGVPAYASAARVESRALTAFVLLAYLTALVLTPMAAKLTIGASVEADDIARVLVIGLIVPTLLGLPAARWLSRIAPTVRTAVICGCVFVVALSCGRLIGAGWETGGESATAAIWIGLTIGVARSPVCALIGIALGRRTAQADAFISAFATGHKNIALGAGIAVATGGPVVAMPCIGGFAGEALLLTLIAVFRRHRGLA